MTRPNNIFLYFITKLKVHHPNYSKYSKKSCSNWFVSNRGRILTEGAIEDAIHKRKERFKQRRLHKVMTVQHISHNSTHVMRRICLWTERSKRVWRRKKVSITASFRSFEISKLLALLSVSVSCNKLEYSQLPLHVRRMLMDRRWPLATLTYLRVCNSDLRQREDQCKQHSITGTGHKPRNLDPEFGAFTFPFNALSIKMWRNMTIGKVFSCSFVTCLSKLYDFIRMN